MIAWVNGQPASRLSVADRGLAYGDGVFETMRVEKGKVARLELHLARLSLGCQRLHIPIDVPQLADEIRRFCRQVETQATCKLIVTRGVGQRGYAAPNNVQPQRVLQLSELPAWPSQNTQQGVRLFACQTRLSRQPLLAGIKHLNRLEQVMARAEWQGDDFAEGLMLDTQGYITDCVFSNIFFVQQDVLITPCLNHCGVAGVMRRAIMSKAQELGVACQESKVKLEQLADMDEVFTSNSLYGIWPVRSYQQLSWPLGRLTRTLQFELMN